jgi:type II secretory pathway component GspD/PulD (secretin)/tetratricopeptide (TPR) repeat protein
VFFDPTGPSSSVSPSTGCHHTSDSPARRRAKPIVTDAPRVRRGRKLMLVALAVAMATPVAAIRSASVYAAGAPGKGVSSNATDDSQSPRADFDPRADFAPVSKAAVVAKADTIPSAGTALQAASKTDADLLKDGQAAYENGDYEAAQASLQKVNASNLSDKERRALSDTLSKAESAANERRAARAQFELGEAALKEGKSAEAIAHYQAAVDNKFVDAGTKAKSVEQIELAKSTGGATPAPEGTAEPVTPVVEAAPTRTPKQSYELAVKQYKSGDWIPARENFNAAIAGGYKAGLFQDPPQRYLSRMDKKELADAAKAEAELATARAAEAQRQRDAAAAAAVAAEAGARAQADVNDKAATEARERVENPQVALQTTAPATGEAAAPAAPVEPATAPAAVAPAVTVDSVIEQANKAVAESRFNEALTLYDQALSIDPNNKVATEGRARMLELTGRNVGGGNLLAQERARIEARRDAINYNFNDALGDANEAIRTGNFADAKTALQRARVASVTDRSVFSRDEINAFESRIANSQAGLEQAEDVARQREVANAQAQTNAAIEQKNRQAAIERERTIRDLINQTRTAIDEARYDAAIGTVEQILRLDPRNDYAIGVKPFIQDKANLQQQREFREQFNQQATKVFNRAEEGKIPYDEIIRYPENWPDLSARRDRTVAAERGVKQEDAAVQAQLDKRLPEVKFDAVGFNDVIEFLRDVSGANIFVNWRALEAAGIDRNAPVTARLRDVAFRKALDVILQDVGGGTVKLAYTIDQGVITISTADELATNTITQTYDIRDLIINVPDFDNAPQFDLNAASQNTGGGGGGGGGGTSLFGGTGGGGGDEEQAGPTRTELVEQITNLIQTTVANDTWQANGGTVGTLSELNGTLIVTQTPENQEKVSALLEKLREQRAIQVTVEARFLTVQRNFLEDIGVDFDFAFNTNGDVSSSLTPVAITNNSSAFTSNPTTGVPGTIGANATPAQGLTASNLDGTPIAFTFLDDFQASFLIRATQASVTSTSVTAPRLTLFNGQRAYVVVSTVRAYVSDLQPTVAQNAVAFDPEISTVNSGVSLDVQATVSSDRKYVTLTMRPRLSTLIGLFTFQFTSGSTAPAGSTNDGTIIGGTSAGTGVVQQPEIQQTLINTTVSVPDGGTLLLGGQTLAGEIEKEAGVPVLSKIPFLKRLFTNRSMAKDEQVLLILVKPTIIIQREVEEKQFPLLSSRVSGG